jgi:hypothetical protein
MARGADLIDCSSGGVSAGQRAVHTRRRELILRSSMAMLREKIRFDF